MAGYFRVVMARSRKRVEAARLGFEIVAFLKALREQEGMAEARPAPA